ncbi:hypothetical protein V8G54_032111 [Vigna mungo]|uniref:Phytocyanin domain-containing protein n=1 Tax=Vigna mungo TaxID=3915 RepID=A0AAQ3MLK9_VIGMU
MAYEHHKPTQPWIKDALPVLLVLLIAVHVLAMPPRNRRKGERLTEGQGPSFENEAEETRIIVASHLASFVVLHFVRFRLLELHNQSFSLLVQNFKDCCFDVSGPVKALILDGSKDHQANNLNGYKLIFVTIALFKIQLNLPLRRMTKGSKALRTLRVTTTSPCSASCEFGRVRKLPGNSFLTLQNTFLYNHKPPSIFVTVDPSLSSHEFWKMKMGKGVIFTVAMVDTSIMWSEQTVAGIQPQTLFPGLLAGSSGSETKFEERSDGSSSIANLLAGLAYSVAQGLVAELKSKEEYEACDVRNPIKMYTEGLHSIPLESKGMRYFVSTQPQNCKNGLKLHIEVLPQGQGITDNKYSTLSDFQAAAPTTPSASTRYAQSTVLSLSVLFFLIIYLAY